MLTAAATEAWASGATAGDKPPKLRICRICRIGGVGVAWRIVYLLDPDKRGKGPARHTLLLCLHRPLVVAGLRPAALPGQVPDAAAAAAAQRRALGHNRADDRLKLLATVALLAGLTTEERAGLAQDRWRRCWPRGRGWPMCWPT